MERALYTTVFGAVLAAAACNRHPLVAVDGVLTAADHETRTLPPAVELDLLLVVDDSGSMAEEQDNLARNLDGLAEILIDRFGEHFSLRIAVTSTDLAAADKRGRFLSPRPGLADLADLAGQDNCRGVPAILHAGLDAPGIDRATLSRQVGCLARLGTRGSNRERGLEAMRLALDCQGPNAAAFGPCCVPGPDGRPAYNRACTASPEFLRPGALLAVVFLTDEDDCSDPASNPGRSGRPLCRGEAPAPGECDPGEAVARCRARQCDIEAVPVRALCRHGVADADGDGVPDAYLDPAYCPAGDPRGCFLAECLDRPADASLTQVGGPQAPVDAAACHARHCAGGGDASDRTASLAACQWFADRLTPVDDYAAFLAGLKAEPARQLVVAALTGAPLRTPAGAPVRAVLPIVPRDPGCAGESTPSEACCPGGACEGPPRVACTSQNGRAATGWRYLDLAGRFNTLGLDCEGGGDCETLCDGDLGRAVVHLADVAADLLSCHCLAAPPDLTSAEPPRVSITCPPGAPCRSHTLTAAEFTLLPRPEACPSGYALCLNTAPPPGAQVALDVRRALP